MKLTFIRADVPLSKTLDIHGNDLSSYPLVRNVSTVVIEAKDMADFADIIRTQGKRGDALLKGHCKRHLDKESRAGETDNSQLTEWIVFDWDSSDEFKDLDEFVDYLGFPDTDYVFQGSAKCGFKGKQRGHIFIRLNRPQAPGTIKQWVKYLNLTKERFAKHIKLNKINTGLCWPLDITVNDNSKLIYIAPPQGIPDPLGDDRVRFVRKALHAIDIPQFDVDQIEELQLLKLDELRGKLGLQRYRPQYKTFKHGDNNVRVLKKVPGNLRIDLVGTERGFHYFNINGGDSRAYFTPCNTPYVVSNFKEEDAFLLSDADPELFNVLLEQAMEAISNGRPWVFRDPAADTFYTIRTEGTKIVDPPRAIAKSNIGGYFAQFDLIAPDVIFDTHLIRDPRKESGFFHRDYCNSWRPTPYMENINPEIKEIPPTINLILNNITGNPETKEHLLNWIAWIFQNRTRTGTAWIFHGKIQGSGKGTFYNQVLFPLFGEESCFTSTADALLDDKNKEIEGKLIYFVDEVCSRDMQNQESRLWNKIKNLITEPKLRIRAMYQNGENRDNHINVIFASNDAQPLTVPPEDRRINIAEPARQSLTEVDPNWQLTGYQRIESELMDFAAYLNNLQPKESKVRISLKNEARKNMIAMTESPSREFFNMLQQGNYDWLCQMALNGNRSTQPSHPGHEAYLVLNKLNDADKISREDILTLYNWIVWGAQTARYIQGRAASKLIQQHDIPLKRIRIEGLLHYGAEIYFTGKPISNYVGTPARSETASLAGTVAPVTSERM